MRGYYRRVPKKKIKNQGEIEMKKFIEIQEKMKKNLEEQKVLIAEMKENGYWVEEPNLINNGMLMTFPSRETGSPHISIIPLLQWFVDNQIWNDKNNMVLLDKEDNILKTELKKFFSTFEVDNLSEEDNNNVRKEIFHWIEALPDELALMMKTIITQTITDNMDIEDV